MSQVAHPAVCGVILGVLCLFASPLPAIDSATAAAWRMHQRHSATALQGLGTRTSTLGATDPSTLELDFAECFAPGGDEGLVYSERVKFLAGKRVRLTGFMVRETTRQPGVFLLVRQPDSAGSDNACASPEVLPTAVYVHLPPSAHQAPVPFSPGRLIVTGILELGPHREANGRISVLRLRVDHP